MSDLAAIVSSLIEPPYAPWSLGSVRPPFPALLTPSLTPPSSRLRHHSAATVLTHASHANRSQTSPLPRPMPACGQSLTSPTPAASPSSASPCLPCSSRAQRNPGILDMPEHHCSRRRRARRRIQRRLRGRTPLKTLCDTRSCASTTTRGRDCPGHGIPVVSHALLTPHMCTLPMQISRCGWHVRIVHASCQGPGWMKSKWDQCWQMVWGSARRYSNCTWYLYIACHYNKLHFNILPPKYIFCGTRHRNYARFL